MDAVVRYYHYCCSVVLMTEERIELDKVNDKGNLMTIILQRITKNIIWKFIDNKKGSSNIYIAYHIAMTTNSKIVGSDNGE